MYIDCTVNIESYSILLWSLDYSRVNQESESKLGHSLAKSNR
jgi:hypothetical protein